MLQRKEKKSIIEEDSVPEEPLINNGQSSERNIRLDNKKQKRGIRNIYNNKMQINIYWIIQLILTVIMEIILIIAILLIMKIILIIKKKIIWIMKKEIILIYIIERMSIIKWGWKK